MKCHEAKRHLDLFMDGEISVPENLKVLEHLNLCRPCAAVYEGEKALRAGLKAGPGSERAPEGLAARLSRSLGAEGGAVRPFRAGRSLAAAAALFLVASLVFTSPAELPRAFAAEAAVQHDRTREGFCGVKRDDCACFCGACCPKRDEALGTFFRRHVSYDVCAHDLRKMGYELVGASVWAHRGSPICWTVHRDAKGRSITHGLVATRLAMEARPLSVDGAPRPVVLVPAGSTGMTCVFIFDDADAARDFLAQ